jgi:hypothetical protein
MNADNPDPFALGGVQDDSELFDLIEEWRRREAWANQPTADEDETARRCAKADEVMDAILDLRPATLRGVLAVLDLGPDSSLADDPDFWPDEAIEGLRAIVGRDDAA